MVDTPHEDADQWLIRPEDLHFLVLHPKVFLLQDPWHRHRHVDGLVWSRLPFHGISCFVVDRGRSCGSVLAGFAVVYVVLVGGGCIGDAPPRWPAHRTRAKGPNIELISWNGGYKWDRWAVKE